MRATEALQKDRRGGPMNSEAILRGNASDGYLRKGRLVCYSFEMKHWMTWSSFVFQVWPTNKSATKTTHHWPKL